jgi:hypothetical protein
MNAPHIAAPIIAIETVADALTALRALALLRDEPA